MTLKDIEVHQPGSICGQCAEEYGGKDIKEEDVVKVKDVRADIIKVCKELKEKEDVPYADFEKIPPHLRGYYMLEEEVAWYTCTLAIQALLYWAGMTEANLK